MSDDLKLRMVQEIRDVAFAARKEVVDADYVVPRVDKFAAQVGSKKARTARYQYFSRITHSVSMFQDARLRNNQIRFRS